jgi:hypothetical protein
MVLWPAPSCSPKEEWRVPGGESVYRVGSSPAAELVFEDDLKKEKRGLAVRESSSNAHKCHVAYSFPILLLGTTNDASHPKPIVAVLHICPHR